MGTVPDLAGVPDPNEEHRVHIRCELDVAAARRAATRAARALAFDEAEVTRVAIATSEVAQNIVTHAGRGEIVVAIVTEGARRGVQIIATDDGPGIADFALAMEDGFSSADGLGLGLPGAQRLMDHFELLSSPAGGTRVNLRKWAREEVEG